MLKEVQKDICNELVESNIKGLEAVSYTHLTSVINRYILDYLVTCYVCNFTCCILLDDYLDYIQDYYNEVVHEVLIRVSIYYI